jgi:hypothetical protein
MRSVKHPLWFLLLVLWMGLTVQGQTRPGQLRVVTQGPNGQSVQLSRADLYLDVWGSGELMRLTRQNGGATIPTTHSQICRQGFAHGCPDRFTMPSRLVLAADGYAPVTRYLTLAEGESGAFRVFFRPVVERAIQVVDEAGAGIAGVALSGKVLFAESNHCGAVEGEDLFNATTDRTGRVRIPDADGEIAVEFSGLEHFSLQKRSQISATRFVFVPSEATTSVVIHRFEKRPLQLQFNRDGSPAAGLSVTGTLANAGCGSVEQPFQANARGEIRIDDFYPEEFTSLAVRDASGKVIWEARPPFNAPGQVTVVALPSR